LTAGIDAARRRRVGIAFVAISALSFGAMAIFARFAYAAGTDTTTLLALRFTLAAGMMALLAWFSGARWPRGGALAAVVAMGAVGYGGQAFSFFTALTKAPAGLVALLLYLHPALVAVLSALVLRERLDGRRIAALACALAGMLLTVLPTLAPGMADRYPDIGVGVAFGIAAAVIYAVYIVVGARVGTRVDPLPMATIVIGSAAALFATAAALQGPHWPATATGWVAVGAIALVCTVTAISLFFAGLARVGPTQASTLSTIEPLFTVLLAVLLLGETVSLTQIAGGALILGAVVMLARHGRRG
jgi:drug/metabolite transporter (DMT)-like permease